MKVCVHYLEYAFHMDGTNCVNMFYTIIAAAPPGDEPQWEFTNSTTTACIPHTLTLCGSYDTYFLGYLMFYFHVVVFFLIKFYLIYKQRGWRGEAKKSYSNTYFLFELTLTVN